MFTWIFKLFAAIRFKKQAQLLFGLFRAAQETVSSTMQEILETNAKAKQAILNGIRELHILETTALELQYFKDFLGLKRYVSQPVFTVERASDIAQKRRMLFLLLIGFILSETFLYYIISGFVIPGLDSVWAKIAISLFFAFLCMFGIHWGLESHNKHIYAKERHAEGKIRNDVLKKIHHDRILGYLVSALCILFIIAAGMTRIYLVEGAESIGTFADEAQAANYENGAKWISFLTMIFTLVLGVLLAKLKIELFEVNPLYKTYKEWKKNQEKIQSTVRSIEANDKTITSKMEIARNKGWQLILDLQKIMEREYDEQDKSLYEEYIKAKSQPGFELTSDVFNKYHRLLSAFREMFDYTIRQHPDLVDWATDIATVKKEGEEVLKRYEVKLKEDISFSEIPEIKDEGPLENEADNTDEDEALKELIQDADIRNSNGSPK